MKPTKLNVERDAMGADEYHPLSHRGSNFSKHGGIGYMVVDALDTMHLMGLKEEYDRTRHWLATEHTFNRDGNFNSFEVCRLPLYTRNSLTKLGIQTTIRVLGGLLSVFHLTEDPLYLEKAVDLADRMLPIFNTSSGLPLSMANLGLQQAVDDPRTKGLVSTAEATTLQLEYRYLSHVTGNPIYWDSVEKVNKTSLIIAELK
jgi:mannosyl-oligosaccharide alpha-1,2-mannosidase